MRFTLSAKLIFLILVLPGLAARVLAQDGEPDIDTAVDYTFGEEIRFLLTAQNAAQVERITLSFRPEFSTEQYVVDVPFEQGQTVSVTHAINVAMLNLMPYSQVTYSWKLETDKGSWNLSDRSFAYEDDRFDWLQTTREGATAHWTGNGPSFGQDVLIVADKALSSLSKVLPLESVYPFDIYVYPSSADLRSAVELAGFESDETIYADPGVILVTAVNPQSAVSDMGQSIPYELAHLLIYRLSGDNYEEFPWWLAEGVATIVQDSPNPRYADIVDEAVQSDSTIPLWQLCETPIESGDRVVLATAQSFSVVTYISDRFGDQKLADLVQSYAQGRNCEAGVQRTLGITLDQLQKNWLDAQRAPSLPVQFFNNYGLWILILLSGFGLAWIVIRYSTQRKR